MKIVFAQGNPEAKYRRTRHNAGFVVADALVASLNANWKHDSTLQSDVAEVTLSGQKILIVKPRTFYNDTGIAARRCVDYYKVDPSLDFAVVHDDLSLPLGTIRIRQKGSDAGNNGIKSLNAHLGDSYARIRIGIWTETRDLMDDARFVLGSFTKDEQHTLETKLVPEAITAIERFAAGTLEPSSASL